MDYIKHRILVYGCCTTANNYNRQKMKELNKQKAKENKEQTDKNYAQVGQLK